MLLKILAFSLILVGAFLVFAAGWIVKRFHMDRDIKIGFEHGMDEDELNNYRFTRAVVNFKMIGMLVMLPGFILVYILFK